MRCKRVRHQGVLFLLAAALALGLGGCLSRGAVPEAETAAPVETAEIPAETAPPAETEAPVETEAPLETEAPASARAWAIVETMTEDEKLYQLFVVHPEAVIAAAEDDAAKSALERRPVGGFIYAEDDLQSAEQAGAMIAEQQECSKIPLLTAVDEEGGRVTRIRGITGSLRAMYSYRDDGPETAYANAAAIARNLSSLGLNTDFAPVADVWSNPANTVIGDRAYSGDFETAATLVAAAVEGFRSENVVCALKHFPGHGDTAEDSHYAAATVRKTLPELREQEFLPFRAGIGAGADMVMIGHLTAPEVDGDTPATFSKTIVTDILRGELGFEGVVITDALTMAAAANYSPGGEACVQALAAGCDLLLAPADTPEGLDAAVEAIRDELAKPDGRLSWDGVDGRVARILTMKIEHGLISDEKGETP